MSRGSALASLVGATLLVGVAGSSWAADPRAEGRKRARKASQLAAAGKCKPAIPEFSAAYKRLKDPALLFNRGECYRKLGQKEKALADFRQFLADLPNAPNRTAVAARVAELERALAPPAPPPPRPRPAPPEPATVVAAPVAAPVAEPPRPPPAPPPAERLLPLAEVEARDPFEGDPVPRVAARPDAEEPSSGLPTWVWVGLGTIVIAAGAVGGWYFFGRPKTEIPGSTLGNVRF